MRSSAWRTGENDNKPEPTVLLVDDDLELLKYAALVLGKDYPVLSSTNGEEALRIAKKAKPDVIILDVMMPGGMDGFTTFCELKKNPETAHIKVVMLTEVNEATKLQFNSDIMKKYFGDAPWTFLEKPISPDRLLQAVASAIASTEKQVWTSGPRI